MNRQTRTSLRRYPQGSHRAWPRGFTLMELLATIAVLVIVTTIALPSFRAAIQNNRLTSQANELVASFQFARSEALKRGVPVFVCGSNDEATCSGAWSQGWVAVVTNTNEVLRVWPAAADFQFTAAANAVGYQPNGFAVTAFTLDVELPDCTGNNVRRITVQNTGRVASERVACP
ncbi:MAG: GspH/FimT family pseudopilin [Pseudomonadota bacterium]